MESQLTEVTDLKGCPDISIGINSSHKQPHCPRLNAAVTETYLLAGQVRSL